MNTWPLTDSQKELLAILQKTFAQTYTGKLVQFAKELGVEEEDINNLKYEDFVFTLPEEEEE